MIWLFLILGTAQFSPAATAGRQFHICADNKDIIAYFEDRGPKGHRNHYILNMFREIPAFTDILLYFDSDVSLKLIKPMDAHISDLPPGYGPFFPNRNFKVSFTAKTSHLSIQVFGSGNNADIPSIYSVYLDNENLCEEKNLSYLDYPTEKPGERGAEVTSPAVEEDTEKVGPSLDESCGRRKVVHTELIVQGQPSKSGDWPWHVAILRIEKSSLKYICGGTLLSKTLVLTAAHCASIRGNTVVPDSLSVNLGKYNLIGGDIGAQEREVFEVIVHSEFDGKTLNNDIALLKLKSEAVFTDYVQPACLGHEQANARRSIIGTVVGWGFDHQDLLSSTLHQITIPIVSELICLKSNPTFFHKKLNTNKFCAGFANGTSACNGDSGGGLMIFVPDRAGDTGKATGAWYVRGIVSLSPSRTDANICDPNQYTIFTDVEKYRDWLMEYLH